MDYSLFFCRVNFILRNLRLALIFLQQLHTYPKSPLETGIINLPHFPHYVDVIAAGTQKLMGLVLFTDLSTTHRCYEASIADRFFSSTQQRRFWHGGDMVHWRKHAMVYLLLSQTDEYEYFSLKKPESPEQGRTPYKNTKLQSKTYHLPLIQIESFWMVHEREAERCGIFIELRAIKMEG